MLGIAELQMPTIGQGLDMHSSVKASKYWAGVSYVKVSHSEPIFDRFSYALLGYNRLILGKV